MMAFTMPMMGILRAFGAVFLNNGFFGSNGSEDGTAEGQREEVVRGTVLAIDDEKAVLDALRLLLRTEGFNVLTANSGAKGLDMLRYCQRDVRAVVLDYNMPRLTGSETLNFVRKLSPHVKVLGLTGVDPNVLPEDFRRGVDKILTKPYTASQMIDTLNALLGLAPRATSGNS
jgi:CheY-like chemotaxis protein